MATNPWISQTVRSEQNLYEDLVIESLQFYGQDIYYLPREVVNEDKIFLDDVPSHFSDAYKIEVYVENTEGFAGEGDMFAKFGIELRDQATFVLARRRWKSLIGDKLDTYNFRPREGDLIYLPLSKSIFEIHKVETETPFYQLSQLPTFRLQCELFEYNDEDFDTEILDIDTIEDTAAYQYKISMASPETATATATTTIDAEGRVTTIDLSYQGMGYQTPPIITIQENGGSISKFGNSSLHNQLGRGYEGNYTTTSPSGFVELFTYMNAFPSTGTQQAFFLSGGGDSDELNNMMWGVNDDGYLCYTEGASTLRVVTSVLFSTGTWNHIMISVVGKTLSIYYNGFLKESQDNSGRSVDYNLIGDAGYSIGAVAARAVNGVTWGAMDGYIDEFRIMRGDFNVLLGNTGEDRLGSESLVVPSQEFVSDSNTELLLHMNATTATATTSIESGSIDGIVIDTAGVYYNSPPTITIEPPYTTANYERGQVITQNHVTYSMLGEVGRWSDSDNVLYLMHVGADDGEYHTFSTNTAIVSDTASYAPSLIEEIQQIQASSQAKYFDDFESDFLDFSESNPFGDIS